MLYDIFNLSIISKIKITLINILKTTEEKTLFELKTNDKFY